MRWEIIDRLREKKWFVFLFSILFLALNIGCSKKSSGGEGISNAEKCPVWYKDDDGDGYTDGTTKVSCLKPSDEYVSSATAGDCNDNDPNINPGKTEICDGKDNNCNGQTDEGLLLVFYKDFDEDGYTDGTTKVSCSKPAGYVLSATPGDCKDNDPNINPGKTEICDGKDNNCNGQIDEGDVCTFSKTIGGSRWDIASSIIQSSDGGYVVAGWTESFGAGNEDFYVVKLDSSGNVIWTKTIGGSKGDRANSIVQGSDGGYVIAGWTESFGAGFADFYVVKLDSSGNVVWTKTIGGSLTDAAISIIQSSDGGYVVAGYTQSFGAGGSDMYIVKLDSSGNVVWTKIIGGSNDDVASSIIRSSDGGYIVTGHTKSFREDDSDISDDWDDIYIEDDWDDIYIEDDWDLFDGDISEDWDIYVVKLDSSGNIVWTKTIGGSKDDYAFSITQSSDGGYIVAGYTNSFGGGLADFYVVKLDSSGNVIWTKTIGGWSLDVGGSIIQSSDGGYVVAGATLSFGAGEFDFYVVKMDDNGNVCFSQNITNYSVSSNVGSFSSPSPVVISQSPTVKSISPTVSYGGSVSDVCALAKAPYLNMCSASQDCDFGSAIATNKENVKSYGCSAGGVFSRFLIPASMLIIYVQLRRKKKKKKG
jgi:hypothetical protein